MKNYYFLLLVALCFPLSSSIIQAQTHVWQGTVSDDWFTAPNWDVGSVPIVTSEVLVPAAAVNMPVVVGFVQIRSLTMQPATTLTVDTMSTMQIANPAGYALRPAGLFTNYGAVQLLGATHGVSPTMNMGQIRNFGSMGVAATAGPAIDYHDIYNHRYAEILISAFQGDGMRINDKLQNRGLIRVDTAQNVGVFLRGQTMTNECLGTIDVRNCETGLSVIGNFGNASIVRINNARVGIRHQQVNGNGEFTNGDEKLIVIKNTTDTAIVADNIDNNGYLEIQSENTDVGIAVRAGQRFDASPPGQINMYGEYTSQLVVDSSGGFNSNYLYPRTYSESILDWGYLKNEYYREIDSAYRNFLIHVPTSYDSSAPVPMVFMLHGSSGDGTKFYNISKWVEKADQENFIAVFPTARSYYLAENGNCSTKWSSGGLSSELEPNAPIKDDIPFLRGLADLCINTFNIDTSRVYISGFSNGGGFTKSRVMHEMHDVFAATATAGGFGLPDTFNIADSIYRPHYEIVGGVDPKVISGLGLTLDSIPISPVDYMAIDEIEDVINNMRATLNLDTGNTIDFSPSMFNVFTYHEDLSGQENEYNISVIYNLAHQYPNGVNHPVIAVDILWPWFMQFTKD